MVAAPVEFCTNAAVFRAPTRSVLMVLLCFGTPAENTHTQNPDLIQRNEGKPGTWTRVGTPEGTGSLGWFGLGRGLAGVQGLQQAEEAGGLADAAELDAEGLDLDEQVLNVDDLVPYQRL